MSFLFTIFYQPTANAMFILMNIANTGSVVFGILMLVIVTKALLLPTSFKNSKIQEKMGEVSEDLQNIKKTIKDKKEQAEKTLEIYKKAGINPFSPILYLLIQIPFFISIFFVTRDVGSGLFKYEEVLYDFVTKPEFIDLTFLSLNTSENGGIFIATLIVVSQIILMRQTKKKGGEVSKNTKILTTVMPIVIGVLSLSIVATVGIYWLFNNLISILQEILIKNISPKRTEAEYSEKENEGADESKIIGPEPKKESDDPVTQE